MDSWLPTSVAFDHATVRASINGKYYWFDPTISLQRGNIDAIYYPDYQRGLVLSPATTGLTIIEPHDNSNVKVKEVFEFSDLKGEAELNVTSFYTGYYADEMRDMFSTMSNYEIKNAFKKFYTNYYSDLDIDSTSSEEQETSGSIIVHEKYKIKKIWEFENGRKKFFISPFVINSAIKRLKEKKREMPFSLPHPSKYQEDIIINLPKDWNFNPIEGRIATDAFKLKVQTDISSRSVKLRYEYETLTDHVAPAKASDYIAALEEKEKNFDYEINYDSDSPTSFGPKPGTSTHNNSYLYLSIAALGFFFFMALKNSRKRS